MGEETEKMAEATSEVEKTPLVEEAAAATAAPVADAKSMEKPAQQAEEDCSTIPSSLAPPEDTVRFEEESYYVKDLKESQKKALQKLKAKIAEAIINQTFLAPPPKPKVATREVETVEERKEEEKKERDEKEEEKEEKEEGKEEKSAEGASAVIEGPLVETTEAMAAEGTAAVAEAPVVEAAVLEEASGTNPPTEGEKQGVPEDIADPVVTDREVVIEEEADSLPFDDLALWGVPLLPSKCDERTDVVLLKFLRARDFKVNDAMAMLKDTVVWRKEFEVDNLVEEEIASEFDSVAHMHGVDKEGHPVCYIHYGVFQDKKLYQKTFGNEAGFKKFLRWRIQVLERGIQKLDFSPKGVHSMVMVFDLKDSPRFPQGQNVTGKALGFLQDHYPELVTKQIFINVPWYFGPLYTLQRNFGTARSKSKVLVARPEKVTETLFKYISPENMPVQYWGFSRPDDTQFVGVESSVQEVPLKAGEKQAIELLVEEGATTLVWDVVVVGWDVLYGEEFVPSTEGGYTVIIQKAKKVTAPEEPIRNSYKATQPGKVVITIENSSRRKKLVMYRHITKKES